jgi:hypothetical protein
VNDLLEFDFLFHGLVMMWFITSFISLKIIPYTLYDIIIKK